ncbi:MAC/perforin domain-containing protein [Myroides odoratus]|uniref:MAC/perforin domain-containing protein n=1 Tax=Myroides odoratus TaxID=256 RepID=UPI003340C48B
MKKTICVLGLFMLFSCSYDKEEGGIQDQANQIASAGDGKYDLLGYGYDIKGEYADPSSGKSLIFDINRIKSSEPNRIEKSIFSKQSADVVSGSSMRDYTESIAAKFKVKGSGFFGLFKASVYTNFDGTTSNLENYSYASYFYNIEMARIALMLPAMDYNNYLTLNFKEDIIRLTPEEIVQLYGTHVLMDITLGARLNISYRGMGTSSSSSNKTNAGANVKFSASKLFGLDTSLSGTVSSSHSNAFNNQRLTYKSTGGAPSTVLSSFIDIANMNDVMSLPSIDISGWINSINANTITLMKINEDGIVPIYELIHNKEKAKLVKDYVMTNQYEAPVHGSVPIRNGLSFSNIDLVPGLMFIDQSSSLFDGKNYILLYTEHDGFIRIASYDAGSNNDLSQLSSVFDIKSTTPIITVSIAGPPFYLDPSKTSVKLNLENNKKYLVYENGWDKRAYLINNTAIMEQYSFKKNIVIGTVPNLNEYKVSIL